MRRIVGALLVLLAAAASAAAASATPDAKRSTSLLVGINDEATTLYGDPDTAFQTLTTLGVRVLRVNLYWGGTEWGVANLKPADPAEPGDPAYNWTLYDRLVRYAAASGIKVVFSILFTPAWANDGAGRNVAPTDPADLETFAHAAAVRYSGYWTPPSWQQDPSYGNGDTPLPAVTMWTAWNEPNNPVWLKPQYKRVDGKWRIESAFQYAKICTAVYTGIHTVLISPERGPVPGETVACGVTGPRGNDAPGSARPEPDPISFMVAAKRFGLQHFDVWAHHPYPLSGSDPPSYVPSPVEHAVVLGNIGTLLQKLTQLWGPKHLWITEYGYQTNPPNHTIFGISWARQATYMAQAYAIARANPRIDMMLWYLVRDDAARTGWQSGLLTAAGRPKPSFGVFQRLTAVR
jgi:Glycosyl hydrolase catalytic core